MSLKTKSRLLSLILRHKPETIGIKLDKNGWVDVEVLLQALNEHKNSLTMEELKHIVDNNDKNRFTFDAWDKRIRANQGHSFPVDLSLSPETPPIELFHGTNDKSYNKITKGGLLPMNRNHVHLSDDVDTAIMVGKRHKGKLLVLKIDSKAMLKDDFKFYKSKNGVWLVNNVPFKYIKLVKNV